MGSRSDYRGRPVPVIGGPMDGRQARRMKDKDFLQYPFALPEVPLLRAKYKWDGMGGYRFTGWLIGASDREKDLQFVPADTAEAGNITSYVKAILGDDKPKPLVIPVVA